MPVSREEQQRLDNKWNNELSRAERHRWCVKARMINKRKGLEGDDVLHGSDLWEKTQ